MSLTKYAEDLLWTHVRLYPPKGTEYGDTLGIYDVSGTLLVTSEVRVHRFASSSWYYIDFDVPRIVPGPFYVRIISTPLYIKPSAE